MNTINEYDLQFGLLALRMFFVGGEELINGINEWEDRDDCQLADVLTDMGVLGSDERQLVESMLTPAPQDAVQSASISSEEVNATGTTTAATPPSKPSPLSAEATIPSGSNDTIPDLTTTSFPSGRAVVHRFETIRPHAKGAIGEVSIARDLNLRREVALKEMREDLADNPNHRARFTFEAEVTGSLEHPGIVPIYALGQRDDGRPYYAMRFIEGKSMEEMFHAFHEQGGMAGPENGSVRLRELLGQMVDMCNTMAYAHSRGIVHRDLKPANVMLGPYGETLIVDWGLAKQIGAAESPADSTDVAEDREQGFDETVVGQAFGTPQYMSPEQAMGRHDLVDARSDVYSLGATLYKLLTGKTPFSGETLAQVLQAVQNGSFPRPGQQSSRIPKPLEAICLKAMATQREDRYQSATLMAADLTSWMADQPVAAYPEPAIARLRRWMRRHRGIAGTLAIAGCLLFAVLSVGLVMLNGAYRVAERHRQEARGAVDRFFTTVSEDTLLKKPGMENLRADLLDQALKYYQGSLKDERQGGLKREMALTHYYVGRIVEEVESPSASADHYRIAEAIQRKIARSEPDNADSQSDLANTLNAIGRVYDKLKEETEALRNLKESQEIRAELAETNPENQEFQRVHANALMNIGLVFQGKEKFDDAIKFLQDAQAIRLKIQPREGPKMQVTRDLAKGYYNLAVMHLQNGNNEAARREFDASIVAFESLVQKYPNDLDEAYRLGVVNQLLGDIIAGTKGFEFAEPSYQKAVEAFQSLVYKIPGVIEYQYALANVHITMGELQPKEQAVQSLDEAERILTNLKSHASEDPFYEEDLQFIATLRQELNGVEDLPPSDTPEAELAPEAELKEQ